MYEPIRDKSVHTVREPTPAPAPHPRSHHNSSEHSVAQTPRPAHLRQQLAGHLAALLGATEELRRATSDALGATAAPPATLMDQQADLERASRLLAVRISELTTGEPQHIRPPHVSEGSTGGGTDSLLQLHARAHALAGRALVVAAAQQDTATAMLVCTRMDAHEAAHRDVLRASAA